MAAKFDYTDPVNPDAPKDSLEAKAPYIDHGVEGIGPERYFDKEWMAREWDQLWTRTWLIAGPRSDLEEPGDFFTFDIGRESIIVALNDAGEIRAFFLS